MDGSVSRPGDLDSRKLDLQELREQLAEVLSRAQVL